MALTAPAAKFTRGQKARHVPPAPRPSQDVTVVAVHTDDPEGAYYTVATADGREIETTEAYLAEGEAAVKGETPVESLPQAKTCEGWMMKKGRGFPYAWQKRYFIFERATCRLSYHAPSATDENTPGALKGSVRVKAVALAEPRPLLRLTVVDEEGGDDEAGGEAAADTPRGGIFGLFSPRGQSRNDLPVGTATHEHANKDFFLRPSGVGSRDRWVAQFMEASVEGP